MERSNFKKFTEKFLVDYMLGRLCRWMRILGLDTAYYRPEDNLNIVYRSLKEKRAVISRDLKLKNSAALKVFIVESDNYRQQLKNVIEEFDIKIRREKIFSRCPDCNTVLKEEDKEKCRTLVPEYVYLTRNKFSKCAECKKIYWEGTHRKLVVDFLKEMK